METPTIWSRVGRWFRPGATPQAPDDKLPRTDNDGLLIPVSGPSEGNGSRALIPLRRRGRAQALYRLEDGYVKLAGLVDSINKHLESQDERTRQVVDALSQLTRTVAQLPDAAHAQHRQLTAVAEQLESSNARFARWETTISQIPNLVDAQRETLRTLAEQVDSTRKTHEHIAQSMDGFGGAVDSLGQAFGASVETLKGFQVSAASRDDRLTTLLADQNRKFTRLFVGAVVLAAALGMTTVAMWIMR